jgi:hypothetical protein
LAQIIRFRMLMIAAGYEDGNDAATLRRDPMFKLALDRLPSDEELCSQSTISRLENLPDRRALLRLGRALIEQYCASGGRLKTMSAPPLPATSGLAESKSATGSSTSRRRRRRRSASRCDSGIKKAAGPAPICERIEFYPTTSVENQNGRSLAITACCMSVRALPQ